MTCFREVENGCCSDSCNSRHDGKRRLKLLPGLTKRRRHGRSAMPLVPLTAIRAIADAVSIRGHVGSRCIAVPGDASSRVGRVASAERIFLARFRPAPRARLADSAAGLRRTADAQELDRQGSGSVGVRLTAVPVRELTLSPIT